MLSNPSQNRKDIAALLDIANAAQLLLNFSQGLSQTQLQEDALRQSAILYQITVIGEATKRLSFEFRSQHPEVPWSNIAGMRDIVSHQYDRLDLNIVWQVVTQGIPNLLASIRPLLPTLEE